MHQFRHHQCSRDSPLGIQRGSAGSDLPPGRDRDGVSRQPEGRSNNTHITSRLGLVKRGKEEPPPTATATEAAQMDR